MKIKYSASIDDGIPPVKYDDLPESVKLTFDKLLELGSYNPKYCGSNKGPISNLSWLIIDNEDMLVRFSFYDKTIKYIYCKEVERVYTEKIDLPVPFDKLYRNNRCVLQKIIL